MVGAIIVDLPSQVEFSGMPELETEWKFHPKRKWRFDYAYPELKIGMEREGGIWTRGRHVRGKGFEGDVRKYNTAALMGWIVIRFTPDMERSGEALEFLKRAVNSR